MAFDDSKISPSADDSVMVEKSEHIQHIENEKDTASEGGSDTITPAALRRAFSIDPSVEKSLVRKMDWNLVPLLSVLYLLSFIDRSNIGNAKTAGMSEALDLYGNRFQWLLNIFYIPYIVFEFAVIGWKIFPPHIWGAAAVFGWGVASVCQAAAFNWAGAMVCRFFLGIFEASYGPGIPFLLSFFYLRHEVGFRVGMFLSFAPLASCFAGALAYGITSGHPAIASWRLLFLVEALPTAVIAVVVFFYLPDNAETARFLTSQEREMARARTVRQVGEAAGKKRQGSLDWADVWATFLDVRVWLQAIMFFSCNVSFASLPVFLPTILEEMGYSKINAQGLTAPPYFLSFLITFSSCYIADRLQQRGYTITLLASLGGIGYILLVSVEKVAVRYLGVFLAAAGIFPSIANILSWVVNNQGSDTRRGVGIALLNVFGQCGPLVGTNIYPETDGPRYIKGFSVCAAFCFLTAIVALTLRTLMAYENRKKDQEFGVRHRNDLTPTGAVSAGEEQKGADSSVGEDNYGPNFRYML